MSTLGAEWGATEVPGLCLVPVPVQQRVHGASGMPRLCHALGWGHGLDGILTAAQGGRLAGLWRPEQREGLWSEFGALSPAVTWGTCPSPAPSQLCPPLSLSARAGEPLCWALRATCGLCCVSSFTTSYKRKTTCSSWVVGWIWPTGGSRLTPAAAHARCPTVPQRCPSRPCGSLMWCPRSSGSLRPRAGGRPLLSKP